MNNLTSTQTDHLSASSGPSAGARAQDSLIDLQINFLRLRIHFCYDSAKRGVKAFAIAMGGLLWAYFSFHSIPGWILPVSMCMFGLMGIFFAWYLLMNLREVLSYNKKIKELEQSRSYIDV